MTKMDGDSRGGAALSTKKVTGRPIKFVGMGEKMDELDEFHPERMASRILGMGDMMSLIEKAQEDFDEDRRPRNWNGRSARIGSRWTTSWIRWARSGTWAASPRCWT